MNGPMNGTSIQDLHQKQRLGQYEDIRLQHQMGQMQYDAMHNNQHEQGHNATHHVQQSQHAPYYNIENNAGYPQYSGPMPPLQAPSHPPSYPSPVEISAESMQMPPSMRHSIPDIEDLARDISIYKENMDNNQ